MTCHAGYFVVTVVYSWVGLLTALISLGGLKELSDIIRTNPGGGVLGEV